jgi:Tfp pilus assembly protein PilV
MKTHWQHRKICGFTLAEVVIAVGVITFGLVGVYSLLPAGLRSFQESKNETTATELLSLAALDMRSSSRSSNGTSWRFGFTPFAANPAQRILFLNADGGVVSTRDGADFLMVASPLAASLPQQAAWSIRVEWPARAASPTDAVETIVVLQRNRQP